MDLILCSGHLSDDELAKLLDESEGPAIIHRLIPHLARGCEQCRAQFSRLENLQARWGYWDPRIVVVEAEEAEAHLEVVLAAKEPAKFLGEHPEYSGWCLCVLLIERAQTCLDFEDGAALLSLASAAAENLGPEYDVVQVADLKARIHALAAVMIQGLGEPRFAEWHIAQCRLALARGSGDPLVQQEVSQALDRVASMREAEGLPKNQILRPRFGQG